MSQSETSKIPWINDQRWLLFFGRFYYTNIFRSLPFFSFFFFCCNLVLISYLIVQKYATTGQKPGQIRPLYPDYFWCILRTCTPSHYIKLHQILKTCCSIYKLSFPSVADTFCAVWFLWALVIKRYVLQVEWSVSVSFSVSAALSAPVTVSPSLLVWKFTWCENANRRVRTVKTEDKRGDDDERLGNGKGFVCPPWGNASENPLLHFCNLSVFAG